MTLIIVGLGNPDQEYEGTRHNVGRDALVILAKKFGFAPWKEDKKIDARVAKGEIAGKSVQFVLPNTYMNMSGKTVKPLISSKKALENFILVQDELDLPLGTYKISYGSGAGGHRGAESVQKALKSKDFVRIRIGISPSTPSGKLRKPDREKVIDFVIGKFKKSEEEIAKKMIKKIGEILESFAEYGRGRTMSELN